MAALIPLRTVSLLFGAGFGGSYLYNHLDGARSLAAELLLKEKGRDRTGGGTGDNGVEELGSRMDALSDQITRAGDRPVVVMGGNSRRESVAAVADMLALAGWVGVVVCGGAGVFYVVMWRGWSVKDLAWVSRSAFNDTVDALQKGVSRVTGAVTSVRRDLGERLRVMGTRVDNVRVSLSQQIDKDVGEVKDGIGEVGEDVTGVKNMLFDVTDRIDRIDDKLDTATTGIVALVRVVSSLAPERLRPGTPFYDLKKFAELTSSTPPAELPAAHGLLRHRVSNSGLSAALLEAGQKDALCEQPAVSGRRAPRRRESEPT